MRAEFAGLLRERVTLERRDDARDGLGGATGAWTTFRYAWAAVTPDPVAAIVAGDAASAMPRWTVMLRSETEDDVQIGDRIGWRGRVLRVRTVSADPRMPDRVRLGTEEAR